MISIKKILPFSIILLATLENCQKTCQKDTDCAFPLICVQSMCLNPYFADSWTEYNPDLENTPDNDVLVPDSDLFDIIDAEDSTECIPSASQRRQTLGANIQSGEGEQPSVVAASNGYFYLAGRKYDPSATSNPYKYSIVKINPDGSNATSPVDVIAGNDLPGYHQLTTIKDGLGLFFDGPPAIGSDNIIYIQVSIESGIRGSIKPLNEITDEFSTQPYGVDNGASIFLVFKQKISGPGFSDQASIEGAFVPYSGTPLNTRFTIQSADSNYEYGEPVVSFSGSEYLVAFFAHSNINTDVPLDKLVLIELDANGNPQGATNEIPVLNSNNKITGRPAIVWADGRWAILWQERNETGSSPSSLHLTTKIPGSSARDTDISNQWISDEPGGIGDFLQPQSGHLAMIWNGAKLAIALRHDGGTAGRKIFLGEFEATGDIAGPVINLFPESTSTFYPSIAFLEASGKFYYLISWLASTGTNIYNIYASAYGCSN